MSVITDIDCLRRVVERDPRLTWHEGKTSYTWNSEFYDDWKQEERTARARGIDPSLYGKCDHEITVKGGSWSIGVTRRPDGKGWSLVWDVWRGAHINNAIGKDGELLLTAYNQELVRSMAVEQGFELCESVNEQGEQVITLIK